jgi:DNA adenine methylase
VEDYVFWGAVMITLSPLRYPGGKTKLRNYLVELLNLNNIHGTYIEPFAGGAGAALCLLLNNYVEDIVINDIDRSIYALWHSILYQSEMLCDKIFYTHITMEEWYKQRQIQLRKNDCNLLDLGFSTLFLNRTNRSGVISAGVIGGYEQAGEYKLDCRFNKEDLINKIIQISDRAEQIHLFNLDCIAFFDQIENRFDCNNSLVYLDPPYYNKGKKLYTNFYKHDDHANLANYLTSNLNYLWITSYDDTTEIREIYSKYNLRIHDYSITHSAGKMHKGNEIMIYSNDIIIPEALIL